MLAQQPLESQLARIVERAQRQPLISDTRGHALIASDSIECPVALPALAKRSWLAATIEPGEPRTRNHSLPGSFINGRAPGWPGRGNVRLSRENAGY